MNAKRSKLISGGIQSCILVRNFSQKCRSVYILQAIKVLNIKKLFTIDFKMQVFGNKEHIQNTSNNKHSERKLVVKRQTCTHVYIPVYTPPNRKKKREKIHK